MPIADVIADKFTMQNVNLSRFSAGERLKIRRFLEGLSDQLTVLLDKTLPDHEQTFSRRKLQALFKVTDDTIARTYAKMAKAHDESMFSLAELSANKAAEAINKSIGVSLVEVGVSEATLKALVNDDISLGLPAKEWWSNQSARLRQRFQNTIRQGVFAGETLSDLKRRVRGRRENGFKDGIMEATSHDAEMLIRTSVQSIALNARMETFKANDDVIKGVEWKSTLDLRTTETCMVLDGQAWTLDGEPMEGTTQPFPGPPPIHWGCRSDLVNVMKSWGDLIRDAKGDPELAKKMDRVESKIPKSTRASMDGQVSAGVSYPEWLKTQPEESQIMALGIGKWRLWKEGTIGMRDLVDQNGRPLTLAQLKEL
jgi:SPP1 gp7 family putative phage head morphogenesis protein